MRKGGSEKNEVEVSMSLKAAAEFSLIYPFPSVKPNQNLSW